MVTPYELWQAKTLEQGEIPLNPFSIEKIKNGVIENERNKSNEQYGIRKAGYRTL